MQLLGQPHMVCNSLGSPWHSRRELLAELALLATVTVVARGVAMAVLPGTFTQDPDNYLQLAGDWWRTGTYGFDGVPTAFRPPLLPLLLIPAHWVSGGAWTYLAILQMLLGLTTAVAVYFAFWQVVPKVADPAQNGFVQKRAGLLAGLFAALDPILIVQSTQIMTETLAAALVAVTWLAAMRVWPVQVRPAQVRPPADAQVDAKSMQGRGLLFGLLLGLCLLCRPTLLPWAAAGLLFTVWAARQHKQLRLVALATILCCLTIWLGWAIRNTVQLGRPTLTTTHGGYTLLLANNASFYEYLRGSDQHLAWEASAIEPLVAQTLRGINPSAELARDQALKDLAWQQIQADPGGFGRATVSRIASFWGLAPQQTPQRQGRRWVWVSAAIRVWYAAFFALATWGAVTMRAQWRTLPWLWAAALVLSLTAIHAVYWSNLRMRAPVVPVLSLLAASGLSSLGRHRLSANDCDATS